MDKLFFKYGLITGLIISALISFAFYRLVIHTPTIDFAKLELIDLNGQKINTDSLLIKPLVINYWATWCKPCVQELPNFEEVSIENKGQVNFLFISDEDLPKLIKFNQRKKFRLFFAKSKINLSKVG